MTESNNDQAARDVSSYHEKMADKDFLGRLYADSEAVRRGAMAEIRPYREAALRAAEGRSAMGGTEYHFGATRSAADPDLIVSAMTPAIEQAQRVHDTLINDPAFQARLYGSVERVRREAAAERREAWNKVLRAAGKEPRP